MKDQLMVTFMNIPAPLQDAVAAFERDYNITVPDKLEFDFAKIRPSKRGYSIDVMTAVLAIALHQLLPPGKLDEVRNEGKPCGEHCVCHPQPGQEKTNALEKFLENVFGQINELRKQEQQQAANARHN